MSGSSRSDILRLLTNACELEHGLACSYLYAAMSLKQDVDEGGIDWQGQQLCRRWAGQLYFVASQEMLHLAQVWNILTAIGGTPYYLRPNFPQPPRFYPIHLPIVAERFGLQTLDRFIAYERPETSIPTPIDVARPYRTVGELYAQIRELIMAQPEQDLFIGHPAQQVGPDLIDFPQIVKVKDCGSAVSALELIMHQGEGLDFDRVDCHWGVFKGVRSSYLGALAAADTEGGAFDPVRACISNPVSMEALEWAGSGANPITDPRTAEVAALFDSVYGLMLRLLQYVFDNASGGSATLSLFSSTAISLMVSVVKPLGEALMRLPAGPGYDADTAGPGFVLARHISLSADPAAAAAVASERLADIYSALEILVLDGGTVPRELLNAYRNLGVASEHFKSFLSNSRQHSIR